MSKPYNLLIFDWDGTLMDSQARIITSFQAAIAELGLAERSAAQIRHIIGLGLLESCGTLFPQASPQQWADLAQQYRHHFLANHAVPTPLFLGVEDTLRTLYTKGYQLAVATSKSRRGLNQALAETGLTEVFHSTRCAEETCSKPDPQMLQEIMAELNIPPLHTLMIGDSEYDLHMAHHAGVGAIAVSYGVHDKEHLLTCCQPLICLDSLTDLLTWLEK